jgi:hypothetical protein
MDPFSAHRHAVPFRCPVDADVALVDVEADPWRSSRPGFDAKFVAHERYCGQTHEGRGSQRTTVNARRRPGPNRYTAKSESSVAARCTFNLHVLAPLNLNNQRLVVQVAFQPGGSSVAPTMVYNGGVDFDTNLETTGGCTVSTVAAPVTFHLVGTSEPDVTPAGDHMRRTPTGASGFFPTALLGPTSRRWYTEPVNAALPASNYTFTLWTNSPGASSVVSLEIDRTDADGSHVVRLAGATKDVNASSTGNHTTTFGPLAVPAVNLAGQRIRVVLSGPPGVQPTMVFTARPGWARSKAWPTATWFAGQLSAAAKSAKVREREARRAHGERGG